MKTHSKLEWRAPKSLKPYARNAMLHTKEQVTQVARSIKRFGFTAPILVDDRGEILAGHARQRAALQLKLNRVPVRVIYGLTKTERATYRLADNQIARNAKTDWELVSGELKELAALGIDLDDTGFRDYEYNVLLAALFDSERTLTTPTHVHIIVNTAQLKVIEKACDKLRKKTPNLINPDALEQICAWYLTR